MDISKKIKILVFNNALKNGEKLNFVPEVSAHTYECIGPSWRAGMYGKRKHINIRDLIKRFGSGLLLAWKAKVYDVLIVDSAITAFIVTPVLFFARKPKILISSFNVPRHRKKIWRIVGKLIFIRVNLFIVHSRYDIRYANLIYSIPESKFVFMHFVRGNPAAGRPHGEYGQKETPFVLSFGGNARDYRTLLAAVDGIKIPVVIVAREYNLKGLVVPSNVSVNFNIPLDECDRLVDCCSFAVFTFDGSEPSCGQISIVTAFMQHKPVICTDCPGVRDYITDGVNGLLVSMGDMVELREKIELLCNDPVLYSTLVQGAKNWANSYATQEAAQSNMEGAVSKLLS